MDPCHHHRVALWTPAQSRLLERASHRQLVGAGSLGHLAAAPEWRAVSVWRRRHADKRGTKNPVGQKGRISQHHPWFFGLRFVLLIGMGQLSPSGGLSDYSAQTPCGVSQRKCLVSRDGGGVCSPAVGEAGHCGRRCCVWLQSEHTHGPRPGQSRQRTQLGLCLALPVPGRL